jgi:hypothetical protein
MLRPYADMALALLRVVPAQMEERGRESVTRVMTLEDISGTSVE